ncbi:unnamed protein product [Ostreobium quekettii]|uniref:Uncharacterized protein n=1 Tax=Ostreobium quekettii TaxID=121088 RepID=A0A8S1J6D8_9CHLO|nr:unnamed protein product [Ostreobium quekettii]|eukprot:evm.model.scf_902.4 EVM.evm.TU.scf_902.4   scf_902:36675-37046(+)
MAHATNLPQFGPILPSACGVLDPRSQTSAIQKGCNLHSASPGFTASDSLPKTVEHAGMLPKGLRELKSCCPENREKLPQGLGQLPLACGRVPQHISHIQGRWIWVHHICNGGMEFHVFGGPHA